MKTVPTQTENPKGLHQRYIVKKIVPNPNYDPNRPSGIGEGNDEFFVENTVRGSEYFVMRLDEGGKDTEHIKACRVGVHAYADAIQHHLPELAKDLKERYPLL